MSWGYKIALAYGSFVIMILFFIFVATRQKNELMEDHYYEKELQFQKILNASENLTALRLSPVITLLAEQVQIQLPSQVSSQVSNGTIEFIRLSDKSEDLSFDFSPDASGNFSLAANKFHPGIYQIRIQWLDHGIPYMYREQFNFHRP